jgi:hypothetical protein
MWPVLGIMAPIVPLNYSSLTGGFCDDRPMMAMFLAIVGFLVKLVL